METTPTFERAGFWRRAAALLIDTLIVGAAALLLAYTAVRAYQDTFPRDYQTPGWIGVGVALVSAWLYSAWQESSAAGATLGKRARGLRGARNDGQPLGFGRASARAAGKLLSGALLLIGFLLAAGREKLALHDRITGTQVVRAA